MIAAAVIVAGATLVAVGIVVLQAWWPADVPAPGCPMEQTEWRWLWPTDEQIRMPCDIPGRAATPVVKAKAGRPRAKAGAKAAPVKKRPAKKQGRRP